MVENVLEYLFQGMLMSDGYVVYRHWNNRLRCWPQLLRKLRGLAESSDDRVAGVGQETEIILKTLMAVIYEVRATPPSVPLAEHYRAVIERLRQLCKSHRGDTHDKLH